MASVICREGEARDDATSDAMGIGSDGKGK